MRILFVWPNKDTFGVKPLGISLLAAILKREGHEVDLFDTSFIDLGVADYNQEMTKLGYFKPVEWGYDVSKEKIDLIEEFEEKVATFRPDLIAFSVLDDECDVASKLIAYAATESRSDILIGNKGAEKLVKKFTDRGIHFYIGEAVGQLADIVNKKLYRFERVIHSPGYFNKLNMLPYLDWSLFDQRHFLKAYDGKVYRGGDHMIGWGCINSCTYCINKHWRDLHGGMKGCMRYYDVERIVDELQALTYNWDLEFYKFHDEDFLLKPIEYFRELAKEYKLKVGLPFTCMTNARTVTPEKAALLKEMGCVSVSIGVEAGNQIIRQILKRRETPEDIVRAVKLLQDNGIRVSAFNMIGLPFDTEETIKDTIKLNREAGIKHPNISFFMPLEGTVLYDISVAYGFYNPVGHKELRTDKPTLKLPGITEDMLQYYYNNFVDLVTKE